MTTSGNEKAADRAAANQAGRLLNRLMFTLAIYWLSGAALQSGLLLHAWWGRLLLILVVPLLVASVAFTALNVLQHPLTQIRGAVGVDKVVSVLLFLAAWMGSQDVLQHTRHQGAGLPPLLPPWDFLALYVKAVSG